MDRRQLLKAAILAGGGGSLGLGANPAATAGRTEAEAAAQRGWIDSHVHVWTPDVDQYPLASGFSKENMRPPSFTPEELLAHARPQGVDRIVLIQMSFYGFDNSYMTDTMRRFSGVFSGIGKVDERASRPQDEMRRLAGQGVRGFRIGPGRQPLDAWINSAGMRILWQSAAEDGLAICPLINPDALPAVDLMCNRFPETRVVIDHFARVGIDGEIRSEDLERLCRMSEHRNVYLKVSAFYALGQKRAPYLDLAPMIRRVAAAFGPERLMWGSDSPYQVQGEHSYGDSVDLIGRRLDFLTDADRQWLLRKTAEKLFF